MNLDCPELIDDYFKRASESAKIKDVNRRSIRNDNEQQEPPRNTLKKSKQADDYGYGQGLDVEKILGATDVYGELMFL